MMRREVEEQRVLVLGSKASHNFISTQLLGKLKLATEPTTPYW